MILKKHRLIFFDILNEVDEISSDVIDAAFEKGNEQLLNLILETVTEKEAVKLDKKVQQEIELEVTKAEEIAEAIPLFSKVFNYIESEKTHNEIADIVINAKSQDVIAIYLAKAMADQNSNEHIKNFLSDALHGHVINYQSIIDAKAAITEEQKANPITHAVYYNDGSIEATAKIQEMIQNPAPEFVVTRPIITLEEKTAFMYNDKTLLNLLINGYNSNKINNEKFGIIVDKIEVVEEKIGEQINPNLLTEAQNLGLLGLDEEEFFNVTDAI